MPEAIAFYTYNSHLSHYVWLVANGSLYICAGITITHVHTCTWRRILPSRFPTLVLCLLEANVRQHVHMFIPRILLLWNYIIFCVLESTQPMKIRIRQGTNRLTCLWQLPPSSQELLPGWAVGVNELESDNRGHAIQWEATSGSAYRDLVPIPPFLPPLLDSSFGGLLHTEQQMFFSWYYVLIFPAAAQSWYYHMRNVRTLTLLAVTNLLSCFSLEPKNLQLCI